MSFKFLQVSSPYEGVKLVELNRPPVNAFNEPFWRELQSTMETIATETETRVIVLASANPKVFTAGLDLKSLDSLVNKDELDPARRAMVLGSHIRSFQAAISSIECCPQPVVAAIGGIAYGLAIDILCTVDIRIASSSTRFSVKEVDVGLAADIGTLARLPKIIGPGIARELALTAREFDATEALRIGFVTKVVDDGELRDSALDTARVIASKPPIAILGTKRLLLHAQDHSVQENLEYTAVWNSVMLQTEDTLQAMKAVLSKTKPSFKPVPKL